MDKYYMNSSSKYLEFQTACLHLFHVVARHSHDESANRRRT
jgi:hypothetical protein